MTNQLRIAFVGMQNPYDRRSWSSTAHYILGALQRHCGEVDVIVPPPPGRDIRSRTTRTLAYRAQVERRLREHPADVVFVPQSQTALAFLPRIQVPIVLYTDITWHLYHDYYPQPYKSPLQWRTRDVLERRALGRTDLAVFSNRWAAASAVRDYGLQGSRVAVAPFGACIDQAPSRELAERREPGDVCTMLFLGVDWHRKGGDIALEALVSLERMGIESRLVICGCVPPPGREHPHMQVIPFLDKNNADDRQVLNGMLMEADVLLLPTRADCSPIVIGEACAFGLPTVATDTGGVYEMVEEGYNGYLVPYDDGGQIYADRIAALMRDPALYARLAHNARRRYEERLNWDAWGRTMRGLFRDRLGLPAAETAVQRTAGAAR